MWLYFGVFGTADVVLLALVFWTWMRYHAMAEGYQRSAARWNILGYVCLFAAGWFACGIGAPMGNLLSSDPAAGYKAAAVMASTLSMFFTVPGWLFLLLGQRKLLKGAKEQDSRRP